MLVFLPDNSVIYELSKDHMFDIQEWDISYKHKEIIQKLKMQPTAYFVKGTKIRILQYKACWSDVKIRFYKDEHTNPQIIDLIHASNVGKTFLELTFPVFKINNLLDIQPA